MRGSIIISLLSAVATAVASDATVVTNNPAGAVYTATLPATAFDKDAFPSGGNVKGSVFAVSSPDGTGVMFQVKFSGLPSEGGPFRKFGLLSSKTLSNVSLPPRHLTYLTPRTTVYHIHDQPVPADGNCTATGGHLDPFLAGEAAPCDPSAPETCQVGDLSGKHGKVAGDPFSATYTDDYASLARGLGSFLGNRSVVLHAADKARITCANFTAAAAAAGTGGAPGGASCGGGSGTPSSAVLPPTLATTRGAAPPTAGASAGGGGNATATYSTPSTPSASSPVVTAGGGADAPALALAIGAAALACVL